MTIKIYNEFKKNGFLMAPYALVQTLGADTAIVLAEVIAELNHAEKLGLNYGNDFLLNKDRIANKLGIEFDDLEQIFDELENLSFIQCYSSDIENTIYVRVYQDNIIKFKQEQETLNCSSEWNAGLKRTQNPTHETLKFTESTLKIKSFLDERLKEPDAIPLILYSYLNAVVQEYENKFGNIIENSDIMLILKQVVLNNKENHSAEYSRIAFTCMMEDFNSNLRKQDDNN